MTHSPIRTRTAPCLWHKALLTCYLLLATTLFTHLTFAETNTPILLGQSSNSSSPFSATNDEFLSVDEAYQLSVSATDTTINTEWIIADTYYLYGEQFHFTIDGQAVQASKPAGEIAYDTTFEKNVEKHYTYLQASIDKTQLPSVLRNAKSYTLAVRYQGCADAGLCYPPETKHFSIKGSKVKTASAPTTVKKAIDKTPTKNPSSPSLISLMLVFALIGGALLNLMPCVFPVLSIKALSLANHTNRQSRIQHGWSYTFGCMITFVVVAGLLLLIRDAGKAVGWGFQLQSPGVITFLAFLFFIMGLSLSGRIQLGARWMGMGQSLTQGNHLSHSFFTGVLAAVVASPCTAPFMASALGYALTQPSIIALLIFAALGLGMALPFLLLSHIPQLSRFLPAPGKWMETFKQAVAFPLYLTSIWLLWVLGQQIGNDSIAIALLGGLLVLFSLWLINIKPQWRLATLIATSFIIAGIIWQNTIASSAINNSAQALNSPWQVYSAEKLRQLRNNNATIFVNLTADWCITCKVNEKRVFTSETLNTMQAKGIYLLEGDWTRYNEEITALLDEYGRGGVPLYLLFSGDASSPATILPQILNPATFNQLISVL